MFVYRTGKKWMQRLPPRLSDMISDECHPVVCAATTTMAAAVPIWRSIDPSHQRTVAAAAAWQGCASGWRHKDDTNKPSLSGSTVYWRLAHPPLDKQVPVVIWLLCLCARSVDAMINGQTTDGRECDRSDYRHCVIFTASSILPSGRYFRCVWLSATARRHAFNAVSAVAAPELPLMQVNLQASERVTRSALQTCIIYTYKAPRWLVRIAAMAYCALLQSMQPTKQPSSGVEQELARWH